MDCSGVGWQAGLYFYDGKTLTTIISQNNYREQGKKSSLVVTLPLESGISGMVINTDTVYVASLNPHLPYVVDCRGKKGKRQRMWMYSLTFPWG